MSVAPAPAVLEQLRRYDTPTVCNVVELYDLYPRTAGYMNGRIQACFPHLPPMVGYASTAMFRSAGPPRLGNVYSGLAEQVASFAELPGPAVVVFQDLDDPVAAAQAVEHYEITRYGSLIAWAKQLGRIDCAGILEETLDEEKAADKKLTAVAESKVNPTASQ